MNPTANRGGADSHKSVLESLCKQHNVDLVCTQASGDAKALAMKAVESGYDLIIAAGGDGTVHEVVNGVCDANSSSPPRLGIIPIGSGNDLAFALGIPEQPNRAFEKTLHGSPIKIDLVHITDNNGRSAYADNNLGFGLDAQVVIATEALNLPKFLGGFTRYFTAVLQTLVLNYEMFLLNITFDQEKRISQSSLFLALGVGPRGGGGFLLNPNATHTDNRIDSCLVRAINRLTAILLLPKAINGRHVESEHVTMHQSQHIDIRADKPLPIHIDGEVFAYPKDAVTHVIVRSVPAAIEVVV